jgi:hypothetical protein
MKSKIAIGCLVVAALISALTGFAHLSCIYFGPKCFETQMAPPSIVQSAIDGTWIAPVGTVVVAAIFLLWAAYALSKAGFIRSLPLLNIGILTISFLCIVRGLLTLQLKFRHPELVDNFNLAVGSIWFVTGVMFFLGYKWLKPAKV